MKHEVTRLLTYKWSNIYPQHIIHNNCPWNEWEKHTRDIRAEEKGNLLVITGITKGNEKFVDLNNYFLH